MAGGCAGDSCPITHFPTRRLFRQEKKDELSRSRNNSKVGFNIDETRLDVTSEGRQDLEH
jgi:hypothetical protein